MFYIIKSGGASVVENRLIAACKIRNIDYTELDPLFFDVSKYMFSENDSFYRISLTQSAKLLDSYLTMMGCRSFKKIGSFDFSLLSTIEQDKLCIDKGINGILTNYFPSIQQDLLESQVESLGGFPVIIKEMGDLGGVGVMKVDSISSLLSILRNVKAKARGDVVLKKYIQHDEQARIIVLNGEVIGEKANVKNGEEVVLNTEIGFSQEKRQYSSEIREMAVNAVDALGLNFAGVDILIGKDGNNYLAEVNMPCAFNYVEDATGVDIAGKIVEALSLKGK